LLIFFFKDLKMNTRFFENGLALMAAVLILVAVAFAASAALTSQPGLEFPLLDRTSALVAGS
jgi:hypothetical protein